MVFPQPEEPGLPFLCQRFLPDLKYVCTSCWCAHVLLMHDPGLILLAVFPLLVCASLVVIREILVVVPLGLHQ